MIHKINQQTSTKETKLRNLLLSAYLLIGVSIMLYTLLYLLFHLDQSDRLVYRCIPGFVVGLSSVITYGIFYSAKIKIRKRIHENR
jgi:hypothetical protein